MGTIKQKHCMSIFIIRIVLLHVSSKIQELHYFLFLNFPPLTAPLRAAFMIPQYCPASLARFL